MSGIGQKYSTGDLARYMKKVLNNRAIEDSKRYEKNFFEKSDYIGEIQKVEDEISFKELNELKKKGRRYNP